MSPRLVSPQGGRPPDPTETMVRMLVLKRMYNLSDEQMEYQLLDRMSYKRFCGLANATTVPDRTTVLTFENRLGEEGTKLLFDRVSAQLLKKGFIARGGQIIDATWTKGGKNHLGYKLSIDVDKKHKIIRRIETDTASTHDSQDFDNVFDPTNTSPEVYADQCYPSEKREAWLNESGLRKQVQRNGESNKRIGKTRARLEHVYAAIEQTGVKLLGTIGEARANSR